MGNITLCSNQENDTSSLDKMLEVPLIGIIGSLVQ